MGQRPIKDGATPYYDLIINNLHYYFFINHCQFMLSSNTQLLEKILLESRINDLLPFLTSVDKKEYVALRKQLKATHKQLSAFTQNAFGSWSSKMNPIQYEMFTLAGLVICDSKEFGAINSGWLLTQCNKKRLFAFLELGKPKWLNQHLNNLENYNFLRELLDNQFITHDPSLFVRSLMINWNDGKNYILADNALTDPHIYARDLPAIFDFPTNIDNIFIVGNAPKRINNPWVSVIQKLVETGIWDKQETLLKCIEVLKKDWSRGLLLWFKELFNDVSPTNTDLLNCQNELMYLIATPYSGAVNFAIGALKKVSAEKEFDAPLFVEFTAAILHRTDCKGSTRTILSIYDKIAKQKTDLRAAICLNLCTVLLIDDLALQEKAVKLMAKYGNANFTQFKTQLNEVEGSIKGDLKKHLTPFFEEENIDLTDLELTIENDFKTYQIKPQSRQILRGASHFIIPDNWNDFLFHIGKVLSQENIADDIEVFLQSFERVNNWLPNDYKTQLKSYEKQTQGWPDSCTMQMFHTFLQHWVSDQSKNRFHYNNRRVAEGNLTLLAARFSQVYDKILRGSEAPILCALTHRPYWIQPTVFVERLLWYADNNCVPNDLDLCAAICRVNYKGGAEAVILAEKLTDKYRNLVYFIFDKTESPTVEKQNVVDNFLTSVGYKIEDKFRKILHLKPREAIVHSDIFTILAARSKNADGYFADFEDTTYAKFPNVISPHPLTWDIIKHETKYNYPLSNGSNVQISYEFRCIMGVGNEHLPELIYSKSTINRRSGWWSSNFLAARDFDVLLSYIPNFTDPLFSQVTNVYSSSATNNLIANFALKSMLENGFVLRPIHHLFIPQMCFNNRKEMRALAGETLIQLIDNQLVDVDLIGKNIGLLFMGHYGSFNRPLEVLAQLKNISGLHNSALKILYESLFLTIFIDDTTPQNVKKLLEDYFDVLVKTQLKPDDLLLNQLVKWRENGSLKKVIKAILATND